MPIFDDDQDGFWATRFGMSPEDWEAARTQAADAAGQAYDADTRAMATGNNSEASDGGGVDKFQTAYQAHLNGIIGQPAGVSAAGQPPAQPAAPPHAFNPTQMGASENGMNFILGVESYNPKTYPDSAGNPTIGWGHKIQKGESFPNGIDIERAERLRRSDVTDAENVVRRHISAPLTQNQFDALTSLAYNAGSAPFGPGQEMRTALDQGDYDRAANAFGLWNHKKVQGKLVVEPGLTRRRADEAKLFGSP